MHGDDVASSMTSIATQTVSKATEIFLELLKVMIERERQNKAACKNQSKVLSGGEVTYSRLKDGGEISMLPSFAKEDYRELVAKAKKLDIPVAVIQEAGKENTVSLFFLKRDTEVINSIVQDIVRTKLAQPDQTERMITIDKEQVEGFQIYCSDHDIPVNFMETTNGVKCIFNAAYEKSIEAAVENFKNIRSELQKMSIDVQKSDDGKLKIIVSDTEQDKTLAMRFCPKAKLERVLQERLGYSEVKAIEAANSFVSKLSDEQLGYYLSGSRQLEQMEYYEKDIKFENENVLTDKYSFCRMQFKQEEAAKLTITDERGHFAVFSEKFTDRDAAERSIRQHLKVEDTETVSAILAKAEKLGFVEAPKLTQFREYSIERESQKGFTVSGGGTVLRLDLSDKETAKKALQDNFGMSAVKAERIIEKASKQSVTNNLLAKAKKTASQAVDTLKHKKKDRGSRS